MGGEKKKKKPEFTSRQFQLPQVTEGDGKKLPLLNALKCQGYVPKLKLHIYDVIGKNQLLIAEEIPA